MTTAKGQAARTHFKTGSGTVAVVLAAGLGTRMKSATPKVMHPLADRPMIHHVLDTVTALGAERRVVVMSPPLETVAETISTATFVYQDPPLGTGDAVRCARPLLQGFTGGVLVLCGDTPLITVDTLARLRAALDTPDTAVVVLGFRPRVPGAYGRLIVDPDSTLARIVEAKDATAAEREIKLCNGGVMAIAGAVLNELLDSLTNDNAKGEYYLTDVVAEARRRGYGVAVAETGEDEVMGINDRADLAQAEALMQDRLRRAAMANGVTFEDPASVRLSHDTRFGRDVTIGPQVVFGPDTEIADNVRIHAFSHITGAHVKAGAIIGPFARLRPGTIVGKAAHVGNFVEVKNTHLGDGAKANHLAYLGDAVIGDRANIGAGTITCNYDGFIKSRTVIGAGAFIGSNSALVAPVVIGDGAIVGAGSVVVKNVAADALYVERAEPRERLGWAVSFREHRCTKKTEKTEKTEKTVKLKSRP